MAHDENFRDSTGLVWVLINLIALGWITMPVSINVARIFGLLG